MENIKKENYKIRNGTYYKKETPESVIDILENCRLNNTRIVLDYGDTKTGRSWGEEYDIKGYIGRSSGEIKIPILVYNKACRGGGGILDNCIIGIKTTKGNKTLYKLN